MPRKQAPKPVENKLTLSCEWAQCQDVFDNVATYIQHVGAHMKQFLARFHSEEGQPLEIGTDLACEWRDCDTTVGRDFPGLLRHVYFHAFHVKLKSLGTNMIASDNLQQCSMESSSRNMIPELPERLQCSWQSCQEVYDSPDHFYSHVLRHTDNYPSGNNVPGGCRCRWSECDAIVKSRHKLKEHLRSHTQEKVIACPKCGALFSSNTKFKDHTKQRLPADEVDHHPTGQMFQCSHCNKRFASERLLRDHMRHHAKETFNCSYCNKSIYGGKAFRKHSKQHVNHYKCPLCDMTCSTPSSLRIHVMYRHTESKPFKCQECDYSAKTATCLRRHMERHTNGKYTCCAQDCHFQAKTYSSLWYHYRRIHQDHEEAKYMCHLCEKTFTRGRRLTLHLKQTHRFKWPSGHKRFRYKLHDDGLYRLQTVRYESIELTEQILTHKVGSSSETAPSGGHSKDIPSTSTAEHGDQDVLPSGGHRDMKDSSNSSDLSYNLEMLGEVALQLPSGNVTSTPISKEHMMARGPHPYRMPSNGNMLLEDIEEEYDSDMESDIEELDYTDSMADSFDSRSSESFRNLVQKRKREEDEEHVLMGSGASKFVIGKRTRGVDEDEENIVNIFPQPVMSENNNLLPGTLHIPSPIHVANLSPINRPHNPANTSLESSPSYTCLTQVQLPPITETGNVVPHLSQTDNMQPMFKLNLQQLQESPILSMPTNLTLPDTPVKNSGAGHVSLTLSTQDL